MLAPVNWIRDYVTIKLPLTQLAWNLTEVGLNSERIIEQDGEKILDIEITPNRPDWLSMVGVAREIAAIQNSKVKLPELRPIPKKTADLPITVRSDIKLCPRYSGITVAGVKVAPSPAWMQKRLKLVGLRPINNLVDITNYVMFELGVPIHVFDYDKFASFNLAMSLSQGGEEFESVDQLKYKLPAGTIVIKDGKRVIDLCGIKGGANTGIWANTKNIFIHVPVYTPHYIRRASQLLGVASEASYIYERGADAGGTLQTLQRVVNLVLEFAGGKIASEIIDIKKEKFEPKKLSLSHARLQDLLGIKIPPKEVRNLLSRLGLQTSIPTYRGDINIEEDLIEEVARIFGYNNFPRTLPRIKPRLEDVKFAKDFRAQAEVKRLLAGVGFTEARTFSLTSNESGLKIANPVSSEYAYLKVSLLPSLLDAVKLNLAEENSVNLFEIEKTYSGTVDKPRETWTLALVSTSLDFPGLKGVVELLAQRFGVKLAYERIDFGGIWHPSRTAELILKNKNKTLGYLGQVSPRVLAGLGAGGTVVALEIDFDLLEANREGRVYTPLPKYPPQIEDLSIVLPPRTQVGDVIETVAKADRHITSVELKDRYDDSITLRLTYQSTTKTLTDKEVEKIRGKILKKLSLKSAL